MIDYRHVFTAILCLLFVAAASPAIAAEKPELMRDGTLTVCISKNAYPPLYWKEDGSLTGFEPEALGAIADDMGLELAFNEMAFDGLMPGLMSGRCDMLRSGLYISAERTRVADAIPYLSTGPALLVRAEDSDAITEAADLASKTIAVQASSANKPLVEELSQQLVADGHEAIRLANYPEMPEAVGAVRNYKADALVETDMAAIAIAQNENAGLSLLSGIFDESAQTDYGMYFRPGTESLQQAIIDSSKKLTRAGTFEQIAERYDIPAENLTAADQIATVSQ